MSAHAWMAVVLCCTLLRATAVAQVTDAEVEALISAVNIDSLSHTVSVLSGEEAWDNGLQTVTIRSRNRVAPGNALAEEYIARRLEGYGLDVRRDVFSATGSNVIAVQRSRTQPRHEIVVCAHYDGVPEHAADDNASGTAAVLEAARLLSGMDLPYTVVYALWDEEEAGLIGSRSFAIRARDSALVIIGVLNLEMFGWDGNNDMQCEIHARDIGTSLDIAEAMKTINTTYGIGLVPIIMNPGITASDHAPFWEQQYPAVMLIQALMTGDRDPAYHTAQDRLSSFNLPYFLRLARLSIASLVHFASGRTPLDTTGGQTVPESPQLSEIWPQPLSGRGSMRLALPAEAVVRTQVYDAMGRLVRRVEDGRLQAGTHWLQLDATGLAPGMYFCRVNVAGAVITRRLMVVR